MPDEPHHDAEDSGEKEIEPLPLEEVAAPEPEPDGICPHCGAPLRGEGEILCLRCGKAVDETSAPPEGAGSDDPAPAPDAAAAADGGDGEAAAPVPLVLPHAADRWLPAALAIVAFLALAVGGLMGLHGLFPEATVADPEAAAPIRVVWGQRLEFVVRVPIQLAVWALCGLAGLAVGAWLFARPLGSVRSGALRMLAIVSLAMTVSFLGLPWPRVERAAEALGGAAIFLLLAMLFYRLKPREASIVLGLTLIGCMCVKVVAEFIAWAI